MKKGTIFLLFFALLTSLCIIFSGFSQTPPPSQTTGGIVKQQGEIQKRRKLEEVIKSQRPAPEQPPLEEAPAEDEGPKVTVKTITVEGATLLTDEEIRAITSSYEGQELSLKTMQKIADLITDEYRKKGYVTSRAYIPPQTIKEGVLIIRVVEGKLGNLDIEGNRYFSTTLLRDKIGIKPEGHFDYSALQQSLVYINEHPDRVARAVLVPGKEPGTTDVVINVEDNFPFHLGFQYDNYGSRYIDKDRFAAFLEHNNLLGFDDKLYFKILYSQDSYMRLKQVQYTFPINRTLQVGAYYLRTATDLGQEFKPLNAQGRAELFGVFMTKALIMRENLDVRFNFGFDYKSISNYLASAETSEDEVRIFKTGIDIDKIDGWGRTIFTTQLDIGVPNIMGGMNDKDPGASRAGAGGKFYKWIFNLFRLQPMPWESSFLWKNSGQYSNYSLVASEEFQVGGATSVRGYPPAEHSGDVGYYTAAEWSFPLYFLPKDAIVPFTETEHWYDTLRFVTFYDWATTYIHNPSVGQEKKHTLKGCGYGLRFNVRDDVSIRVEFGYPLGANPSDGNHVHPWVECIFKF